MSKTEYHKLVRDEIPRIIREKGSLVESRIVTDKDELKVLLKAKLQEEVREYLESGELEEIADIMEVLQAFVYHFHDGDANSVYDIQDDKWVEKGGFEAGTLLESVESE